MGFYLLGVGIAFVWGSTDILIKLFSIKSDTNWNWSLVGKEVRWFDDELQDIESPYPRKTRSYFWRAFGSWFVLVLIGSWFSWLNLFYKAHLKVWSLYDDLTAPPTVNAAKWRIRNIRYRNSEELIAMLEDAPDYKRSFHNPHLSEGLDSRGNIEMLVGEYARKAYRNEKNATELATTYVAIAKELSKTNWGSKYILPFYWTGRQDQYSADRIAKDKLI